MITFIVKSKLLNTVQNLIIYYHPLFSWRNATHSFMAGIPGISGSLVFSWGIPIKMCTKNLVSSNTSRASRSVFLWRTDDKVLVAENPLLGILNHFKRGKLGVGDKSQHVNVVDDDDVRASLIIQDA